MVVRGLLMHRPSSSEYSSHLCFSTSAVAWWSYKISIINGARGQGLKINASKTIEFSESRGFMGHHEIVHPRIKDATTLLKDKLEKVMIVKDATIDELKASFCGVWPLFYSGSHGYTLCNPVFNQRGDLTFELESPLDCHGHVAVYDPPNIILHHDQGRPARPSICISGNGSHASKGGSGNPCYKPLLLIVCMDLLRSRYSRGFLLGGHEHVGQQLPHGQNTE